MILSDAVQVAVVHAAGWVMVACVLAHAATRVTEILSPYGDDPEPRALLREQLGPMPAAALAWVQSWPDEMGLREQAEARLLEVAEELGDWEKALDAVTREEQLVAEAPQATYFPPADPPKE